MCRARRTLFGHYKAIIKGKNMAKTLQSQKIAVLISNGFDEADFLMIQKAMIEQGALLRIVSTDSGLVNGWDGKGWGHNFAIDAQLNTALGIDYDAVIIPGGQRSLDKLKLTAHSRRFIGSFIAAMKPVICMGDAVQLLAHTDHLSGKTVSGPESKKAICETAGATWSEEAVSVDGLLMTGNTSGETLPAYVAAAVDMMVQTVSSMKRAA
ncbi:MAG: DJ-1/PfpI family protein [Micavibrio aeruginosavorus]|uniref:DJ-1/PfpI family protein n=1 Tax=Micavibrio aeruginosavorus TaxID=349221 RepID=A0A2W5N3P6_9BACT|nr:MAG: DJ-1/PfpI family protein [Micavibrio aeruginosavorus]